MLGLGIMELQSLLKVHGLVQGQEVNATQLADIIARIIVDNNKAIEQQLVEEGVIKKGSDNAFKKPGLFGLLSSQ